MKAKTYIKGDKDLKRVLMQLKQAGSGAKLVPAVNAGLLIIQNEIQERAPYKTGNYKRSWHIGDAQTSTTGAYNTTGTDVVYGARLEFGFDDEDALGRRYHQAARPHVRPAFDDKRAEALDEVKAALKDLINGAAS